MKCRKGCGACCIAPSISSPIPGMPEGKPAGVRCLHLTGDCFCGIYENPERPKVCKSFQASYETCGSSRDEAISSLSILESLTK
ncbi:MAG: YkgJ family cysteine cluster protein [Nitrospiraceae bacterium]|nr:YkgJ family cysteine cluster protein [Nitrospiraceae bacterium]